jgi:RNA polymerase sigma-70 factor, ECF subfamily
MESLIAANGVTAPFESTIGPYYPALVRRLSFIVGDAEEAQDLAQTAYLRAFEAWPRFDGADPRAWLYTIGIRLALNEIRRRRRLWRRRSPSVDATWALDVDPDLWRALDTLDPRPRAALLLTVLDGYTQSEVGVLLCVPPGTVGSWLSRSKARLRELLREES